MTLRFDPLTGWTFDTPAGPRVLRDPDGLPSGRQLRLLAARGLLELRDEPAEPLTKLDCALAIERAGYTRRTDADLAADMLEAVALHPGATWARSGRSSVAPACGSPGSGSNSSSMAASSSSVRGSE